jgi:hypothetical protein
MIVIVRRWEEVPYCMEFRGFVWKKKLNAISQYDSNCYFEEIQDIGIQQSILSRITQFYQSTIRNLLPFQNYVIDFGVLDDKIIVIELNSFVLSFNPHSNNSPRTKLREVLAFLG